MATKQKADKKLDIFFPFILEFSCYGRTRVLGKRHRKEFRDVPDKQRKQSQASSGYIKRKETV